MKNIIYSLFIALILFVGCSDEKLPEASFDLYENSLLVATPGDMEIYLNWEAASEGNPDGYLLTWTSNSKDEAGGELLFGADEKSTIVTDLINGVEYTFAIQSIYNSNHSGKVIKKATPVTSRFTVDNLIAAAGDSRVKLQWAKPVSERLTGYTIVVEPNEKEYSISDTETTSFVITGLDNNREYEFSLIANYSNGASEAVLVKATPGLVVPIILDKTYYLTNQNVSFAFNEMYFMGDIESVLWSFGDGGTSSENNPKHQYSAGGEYTATVEVTYTNNSKESRWVKVYIIDYLWNYELKNSNASLGTIKTSNASFSPDGKTAYIPSSTSVGDLHAINTSDGSLKWIFQIPKITYGGGPSVGADGVIYQGAHDNKVYAINPDGSKRWEYDAGGRVESFLSVTANNEVFALSNTNLTLHAITSSGSAKWTKVLEGNPGAVAVVGNIVYAGTSTAVFAFDMEGNQLWRTPANTTERGVFAFGNTTLYVTQKGGDGLMALDLTTGAEKWTYKNIGGDAYGAIVGVDGTIYFTDKTGRSLYAVNSDGSEKWVFTTKYQLTYSLPALDENGIIYFSTFNQDAECAFYAVNSADGSEVWKMIKSGSSDAEKGMAGVTVGNDKKLYVSTIAGGLYAIPIFAGPELNSWSVRGGSTQGTSSR